MPYRCTNCFDPSDRAAVSPFLCATCEDKHRPGRYRTELTPIGEQLVIPGCERQPVAGKPAQLSLFGG